MRRALDEFVVEGINTTIPLHAKSSTTRRSSPARWTRRSSSGRGKRRSGDATGSVGRWREVRTLIVHAADCRAEKVVSPCLFCFVAGEERPQLGLRFLQSVSNRCQMHWLRIRSGCIEGIRDLLQGHALHSQADEFLQIRRQLLDRVVELLLHLLLADLSLPTSTPFCDIRLNWPMRPRPRPVAERMKSMVAFRTTRLT